MSWLPESLRSFDGDPVDPADANRSDVRLSLMRRHRNTMLAAILSVPPTVVMFVVMLWPHSSHAGLLWFAALSMSNPLAHWWLHLRLPLARVTVPRMAAAQVISGATWVSLPIIAMPAAPEWQAIVGTIMIAVLAAGLVFATQFAVPYAGWVLTISAGSIIGFLRLGTAIGNTLAFLSLAAAGYSLLVGAVLRAGDLGASAFAARNADLIGQLRTEKQHLRELATTDPLTAIGNRLAFTQDLDDALRGAPSSVAIAVIDLDDFKRVNDTFGHHAGDEVLRSIANRLGDALEADEELYRLGGDELTVLQIRSLTAAPLTELGGRLVRVFDKPLTVAGRPMELRASIGIAESQRGADPEEVLRGADEALYRAKRSSDDEISYFGPAMQIDAGRRAELRDHVVDALEAGQIVPWLQPVVELGSGAIVGAEALARWEHPDGVRSAGTFIEAIEEAGVAHQLNELMFEAVCEFGRQLSVIHGGEFFLSCNVSPEFLHMFLDQYEASGELAGAILEITEQRDLANHRHLSKLIERAQAAGARVVVDDFGTGFSSMQRISLGSFDGLKIDGGFVQALADGPNDVAIVASIAVMGRQMRVPVVAEGIEAQHHADRLKELGVHWGQGYLYSPAIPFADLAEIVAEQRDNGPYFAHFGTSANASRAHSTTEA